MPETIRSGFSPSKPRSAKRTQSTGVPSVAKPLSPSSNSTSSTQSGERVVMLRAVAERFESGRRVHLHTLELAERAAERLDALGADSIVVCDQNPHYRSSL